MTKTTLYAREGVAFDETVSVKDSGGNPVDLTGFALSLALYLEAGSSPEFTLATGVAADAQGLHIVEGGLRIVIDKATLEGVDDDTGEFELFGDLLGDAEGGTDYRFLTDVMLNCTAPGRDFRGATFQITLDAVAASVIEEIEAAGQAKVDLATTQANAAAGWAAQLSPMANPATASAVFANVVGQPRLFGADVDPSKSYYFERIYWAFDDDTDGDADRLRADLWQADDEAGTNGAIVCRISTTAEDRTGRDTVTLTPTGALDISLELPLNFGDGAPWPTNIFSGGTFATTGLNNKAIVPTSLWQASVADVVEANLPSLARAQFAVDETNGPFDPSSTALPDELKVRVKRFVLEHAKDRYLSISGWKFYTDEILLDVFDEVIGDQVGYFRLATPNYANLPERIKFTNLDRLPSLPGGDPDGSQGFPVRGYVELYDDATALGAGTGGSSLAQPSAGEVRINKNSVRGQLYATVSNPLLRGFAEMIEAGPSNTYTTPRAALDSLLEVPQPTDSTASYIPNCVRATDDYQIGILVDVPNSGDLSQPWLESNLFLPPNVSLIARWPGTKWNQSPGATRPILQVFGNNLLAHFIWENTIAEDPGGYSGSSTSSARYAIHFENTASLLLKYPQTTRDYTRHHKLTVIGGKLRVGGAANIQAFGSAIPTNATVEMLDVDFDARPGHTGPIAAANTSSLYVGGGRWIVRNGRDISRRAFNVATGNNSTLAVQTKSTPQDFYNELILESCLHFDGISHTGTIPNLWKLRGNWQGEIFSNVPDGSGGFDMMGYV